MKTNTNTIDIIQKIARVGRIVSKIIEVCCKITVGLCIASIVMYAFVPTGVIHVGNVTVYGLLGEENIELNTMAVVAVVGVLCAAYAVVARCAVRYFDNELQAGTPFTMDGAAELIQLGIMMAAIPLAAAIICQCGVNIATYFADIYPGDNMFDPGFSLGAGMAIIVLGLICKYGAESIAAKELA